jgi:hypothetical protein
MPLSAVKSRYVKHSHTRLCQGDILRDVVLFEATTGDGEDVDVIERSFPYVVVLTQDCDLEQDENARKEVPKRNDDKFLQSVLLCPAYQSTKVKLGTHLSEMGRIMQPYGKDLWRPIEQNTSPRYHMLAEALDFQLPELVLDFKQYFTSPREFFCARYKGHYVTSLGPLTREFLSQRFAYYLSRIGLPEFESSAVPLQPVVTA